MKNLNLGKSTIVALLLFISMGVQAGNASHNGIVSRVVFYKSNWSSYDESGSGMMGIYMDPSLPAACGAGNSRVVIGSNHPLYQSVVSTVLAAKIAGAPIKLQYLTECSLHSSSWDFGYIVLEDE